MALKVKIVFIWNGRPIRCVGLIRKSRVSKKQAGVASLPAYRSGRTHLSPYRSKASSIAAKRVAKCGNAGAGRQFKGSRAEQTFVRNANCIGDGACYRFRQ